MLSLAAGEVGVGGGCAGRAFLLGQLQDGSERMASLRVSALIPLMT